MYDLVEPPPKFGLSLPELVSSRLGRPILTKNRRKNLRRAHEVMTDDPSETVFHAFNAVMDVLQRRIIDEKGVKVLEDLQKQKKVYLDTLLKILKDADVEISRDLENQLHMLRELRNRVVHEGYKATESEAVWALRLVESLASSWYPIVLNWLDP